MFTAAESRQKCKAEATAGEPTSRGLLRTILLLCVIALKSAQTKNQHGNGIY